MIWMNAPNSDWVVKPLMPGTLWNSTPADSIARTWGITEVMVDGKSDGTRNSPLRSELMLSMIHCTWPTWLCTVRGPLPEYGHSLLGRLVAKVTTEHWWGGSVAI